MNPFAESLRAIFDRYLEGRQPLDAAARDFAHVWKEWTEARDLQRPHTLTDLLRDRPNVDLLDAGGDLLRGVTEEEFSRFLAFMEVVSRKLSEGE